MGLSERVHKIRAQLELLVVNMSVEICVQSFMVRITSDAQPAAQLKGAHLFAVGVLLLLVCIFNGHHFSLKPL